MKKQVVPFPRINSRAALEKMGVNASWSFLSGKNELSHEFFNDCECRITDKTWYPDESPVTVNVSVEIKEPVKLFHGTVGGCPVATKDSVIGLAVRWMLPKTGVQGVKHCCDIVFPCPGGMSFRTALEFPPKIIRFELIIEVVLYLKTPDGGIDHIFAKTSGALLGPLARIKLLTGGGGGYFPTEITVDEGGPLWRIHANLENEDDFREDFDKAYFCLILNKAHPLYEKVYVTSMGGRLLVSPLMFEIFTNACVVFVSKAKAIENLSWDLTAEEKDDPSVLVNFKAFKKACLNRFSQKEILEWPLEELMLHIRNGLGDFLGIDYGEEGSK